MTAFFLAWYFLYVLLADYAHDFMSTKVWGNINVGLLLGLGQFVSTFAITMIYARWANNRQDPVAEQPPPAHRERRPAGRWSRMSASLTSPACAPRRDRGHRQPVGQHRDLRRASSPSRS